VSVQIRRAFGVIKLDRQSEQRTRRKLLPDRTTARDIEGWVDTLPRKRPYPQFVATASNAVAEAFIEIPQSRSLFGGVLRADVVGFSGVVGISISAKIRFIRASLVSSEGNIFRAQIAC
jgi:hypothetical protein